EVPAKQRPALTRKQGVLELHDEERGEGDRVFSEQSFIEVQNHPVAPVHRLAEGKGRVLLPQNMAEARIGGKSRNLVEDRLAHDSLHGLAGSFKAEAEVVGYVRVRHTLQTR